MTRVLSQSNHLILPIMEEMHRIKDDLVFILKVRSSIIIDSYIYLSSISHLIESNARSLCFVNPFDSIIFMPEIDLSSDVNFDKESPFNEVLFKEIFQLEILNTHCFFTDRSKTINLEFTGFAITSIDQSVNLRFRSTRHSSIFSLEVMAILETIFFVIKHQMNDITIFSDSKSVLQALKNINLKNNISHLINKIRDSINNFVKRGRRIKLIWIPNHCGIMGNERADSLAKKASRSGIDYQVCTSNRDFSAIWKQNQFERF